MSVFGAYQDAVLQHNSNIANPDFHHSHLVGRTDITDHTSCTAILVDSNGHLIVDTGSSVSSLTEQQTQTLKLDNVNTKLENMNSHLVSIKGSVGETEGDVENVKSKLDTLKVKLDDVKNKLDSLKSKQDITNNKLENTNTKLDNTNSKLENLKNKLENLNETQTAIKNLLQNAFSSVQ